MVLTSVIALTGLGLVAAALLAMASKVFAVPEDPRVEKICETLPGANCGGCGYAGCEGYAVAVVNDESISPNLCVVGGPQCAAAIGELTGKLTAEMEPLRVYRRCDKNHGKVLRRFEYQGISTCAAVAALHRGADQCTYSCLGFGDCVKVCSFDVLYLADGVAKVNSQACTGCGACVKACPRGVLELIPKRAKIAISCSTQDKGKAVMDVCSVGCIHCSKCVKLCPANAISMQDSKIVIDHMACLNYEGDCEQACANGCPRGIIHRRHVEQVAPATEAVADAPAQENSQPAA